MARPRVQGIIGPRQASRREEYTEPSVSAAERRQETLPIEKRKKMATDERAIGSNGPKRISRPRMHPKTNATPPQIFMALTLPPY